MLDTLKNTKRIDIVAKRQYVKKKRRSQGQRHGHEKEWQNHHWKAVDAAKNCNKRGFFVYCGKMDRRSFLPIPSAIPWSLEYCLFLDYLKTIQIKPTTPLKENDYDTEAISY